ncbi:hypothetical protein BOO71_0002404 [Deinococcus marmoris]|uniref:Uncharacterized protein n=2 Tax=Deinococcus marmoris TaxID=249408 RepID=A0A1U7P2Z9_9DEIO|nr:hypothetical protein BOO71_0002404 [Deinococcus marmoris]
MRTIDDDGEGHPQDHDTARSIGTHLRRLRRAQGEPERPGYDPEVQQEAKRRREIKKARRRDREELE